MSRESNVLAGIDKSMRGLEIAPWFAPLVPKRQGYQSKIVDVFDHETLLRRARADRSLVDRDLTVLEEVDFVGSATEIAALVPTALHGSFDYIVSSHNFEHLPNPIKFLQGCEAVLKPGGLLSMAVPDRRACFDFFKPNTALGDWLDAFAEDRQRPTRRQVFDHVSQYAFLRQGETKIGAFTVGVPIDDVVPEGRVTDAYRAWYVTDPGETYHDVHCTMMTPASLELILCDVRQLGLARFDIEDISEPQGCEFYVRLRFDGRGPVEDEQAFMDQRARLMRRVIEDYRAQMGPGPEPVPVEPEPVCVPAEPEPAVRVEVHAEPPPRRSGVKKVARAVRNAGRVLRGKPAKP